MSEQLDDGQLLRLFNEQGDESALGELMRRHGGLVRTAICNVMGNAGEADDIAEATFLALVRKAGRVHAQNGTLVGWLFRVATCLARNARRAEFRRMAREKEAAVLAEDTEESPTLGEAALAALSEELGELAEKYRQAVILHHLEGLSYAAAAPLCNCTEKTFSMRLTRGREQLRKRLSKRGVTLGAAALVVGLGQSAASAAPLSEALVSSTCQAAVGMKAGGMAAATGGGLISAKVASLTDSALKLLFWGQVKTVAAVCATVAVVGAGGVGITLSVSRPQPAQPEPRPPAIAAVVPSSTCATAEPPFYLVSNGGWWYGPYRPEQRSQLDSVKTGEFSDLVCVQTNQPYHGLFQEMGYRRIDLRRTGSSFFELSVRCCDQLGHFLVDSGSGNEMLYQSFADLCGQDLRTIMDPTLGAVKLVAVKEARTESGTDLRFPAYFVVRPDRKRSFQPEGLVPDQWEAFGIIGNEFLRENRAILDYDAEALFILPQKTSEDMKARMRAKMASLGYHPIPLRWDATNLYLKVTVQIGTNTTDAVVDTGASATSVDRSLAIRLGLEDVAGSRQRFDGESTISWKPTTRNTDPQASRSTAHDFRVDGFPVHLRKAIAITDPGIPSDRGDLCVIIGNDVFAMYGAVLDFGQNVLYLRKSQTVRPIKALEPSP